MQVKNGGKSNNGQGKPLFCFESDMSPTGSYFNACFPDTALFGEAMDL